MSDEATSEISVEVRDRRIVVTKPGTDFAVAYEKRDDANKIIMTHSWVLSNMTSPTISQFRTRAFQVAVEKARELGWIA